jgi:hypothetical protein
MVKAHSASHRCISSEKSDIDSVNRMGELVEDLLQISRLSRQPLSENGR